MIIEVRLKENKIIPISYIKTLYVKKDLPLKIKINFSEDWSNLLKYIVFSSNSLDYEEVHLIESDVIDVPQKFLRAPGVTFHFYGVNEDNSNQYRVATTFLTLNIEEENLKWIKR